MLAWEEAQALLRQRTCLGGKRYHTGWLTIYIHGGRKFVTNQPEIDAFHRFMQSEGLPTTGFGTEQAGMEEQPRLYRDLAEWWPVLSAPEDYVEEAAIYARELRAHSRRPVREVLELGCGGGSNASHLKRDFAMTLVDLSPGMLEVSRALNPECEHAQGDMRSVRLGRVFDAVFVHDAVSYMATEADLRAAMATAFAHCRPGAVALFCPDHTREEFRPSTSCGGHDRPGRSMRYVEWTFDPDPGDTTYESLMAYVLREEGEAPRCVLDRHICGLFARAEWLRWLKECGFEPGASPFVHSEVSSGETELFFGVRP